MIDYPTMAWVYSRAVDMRCSIDGLSMLVHKQLCGEQGYGTVFVFINKPAAKLAIFVKKEESTRL